jgi:hypothetical protein
MRSVDVRDRQYRASWPGRDSAGRVRPRPGPDVDAVDRQTGNLAVDVGTGKLDTPHHGPAQVDPAEPRAAQLDGAQSTRSNREPRRSA